MLLLPTNMVYSKVRSWDDECENNNNNSVKNEILRTPPRCTLSRFFIFLENHLKSFVSSPLESLFWRQQSANMHRHLIFYILFHFSHSLSTYCPTHTFYLLQMVFALSLIIYFNYFLVFTKKNFFIPHTKIYFTKK